MNIFLMIIMISYHQGSRATQLIVRASKGGDLGRNPSGPARRCDPVRCSSSSDPVRRPQGGQAQSGHAGRVSRTLDIFSFLAKVTSCQSLRKSTLNWMEVRYKGKQRPRLQQNEIPTAPSSRLFHRIRSLSYKT